MSENCTEAVLYRASANT